MRAIDLSCDLGEASSPADRQVEELLWPLITSANVACGGHAGDRNSMELAVRHAELHRVTLGAHPSYPDQIHFGRVSLEIDHDELCRSLIDQIEELQEIALDDGVTLHHVKVHGALYNDAHRDAKLASVVVSAIRSVDESLAVVAAPESEMLAAGARAGLRTVREAFADRRYLADRSLKSRKERGALLADVREAAAQALMLCREETAMTDEGTAVAIPFETLCIHGDMPDAVARLTEIHRTLTAAGFTISKKSK